MHFVCPQCGYGFSWRERLSLSSCKATPCPHCHTPLLKDRKSEMLMNWGFLIILLPEVALFFLNHLKKMAWPDMPDLIELPLVLLITVPPLVLGFYAIVRGIKINRGLIPVGKG